MMTSHTPTHTLPTMYSMPWDLQNWMKERWDEFRGFIWIWKDYEKKMRMWFGGITYCEESLLKHQQRTRETNHQDRLSGYEAEDDTLNAGGDEELRDAHHVFHLISCSGEVEGVIITSITYNSNRKTQTNMHTLPSSPPKVMAGDRAAK